MQRRRARAPAAPDTVYQLRDADRVCLLPRLSISELVHLSGLVRTICERSTDVMLLAKRDHVRPIRTLYADIPNLRFRFVDSWDDAYGSTKDDDDDDNGGGSLLDQLEAKGFRLVPLPSFREACPYALMGLPVSLARTALEACRNPEAEAQLLRRVRAAAGQTYLVLHDDEERRIRRDLVPSGMPIVHVRDPLWRTENPFDWAAVIDHAVQLHGIDSCFVTMADALGLRARKFCHAYANPQMSGRPTPYHDVITVWG